MQYWNVVLFLSTFQKILQFFVWCSRYGVLDTVFVTNLWGLWICSIFLTLHKFMFYCVGQSHTIIIKHSNYCGCKGVQRVGKISASHNMCGPPRVKCFMIYKAKTKLEFKCLYSRAHPLQSCSNGMWLQLGEGFSELSSLLKSICSLQFSTFQHHHKAHRAQEREQQQLW